MVQLDLIQEDPFILYPQIAESFIQALPSHPTLSKQKLFWAMALLTDNQSKYFNQPIQQAKQLIAKDFLKDPEFDFDTLTEAKELYKEFCLTPPRRLLLIWKEKIDERNELISSIKYSLDTFEILDKLVTNSDKILSHYQKVKKEVDAEELNKQDAITHGGAVESLLELEL